MPLRDHFNPPLDEQRHWESWLATWPVMMVALLHGKLPHGYFAEPRADSGSSAEISPAGQDAYEVLVYHDKSHRSLVSVITIVSPRNKDSLDHRRAFVSKCAALLRESIPVIIVDVVTTSALNLYGELLGLLGQTDPSCCPELPGLYATTCRVTERQNRRLLEVWTEPLGLRQTLPTMPLWLTDDFAVPLDLNASYHQSCHILDIP
jgi:hypothetical protein